MQPIEALNVLDNVASQVSLNRKDHLIIIEAVKVLENLILGQTLKEPNSPQTGE